MSDVVYKPIGKVSPSNVVYKPNEEYFTYERLFKEHGVFKQVSGASESGAWTDIYLVPEGKKYFITDFQFTSYIHSSAGTTTGYAMWAFFSRYDSDFLARHNQTGVVGNSITTDKSFNFPIEVKAGSYISVQNGFDTRCGWSLVVNGYLVDDEWANFRQQTI